MNHTNMLLITVVLSLASAASAAPCSNATLQGNYGFALNGANTSALAAVVGQISADGAGRLTGTESTSNNGVIASGVALTGTYALKTNCTGSMRLTPSGGTASNYSLAVVSSGTQLEVVETDTGYTLGGNAFAQGTAVCSAQGIKGTFGYRGGGFNVSPGTPVPVAFAGQVKNDGLGNITGMQTGSFGGTVYTTTLTGTASVNSNCTGSVTFTGSNGTTTHADFVIVDGGQSALEIQTDAGAIVITVVNKQ